jgi:hypothetical protein
MEKLNLNYKPSVNEECGLEIEGEGNLKEMLSLPKKSLHQEHFRDASDEVPKPQKKML